VILSFHEIFDDAVIVSSLYRSFTIIPNYRPAPTPPHTHTAKSKAKPMAAMWNTAIAIDVTAEWAASPVGTR